MSPSHHGNWRIKFLIIMNTGGGVELVSSLLLLLVLLSGCSAQCPNGCSCLRGNSFLSCSSMSLTEIPNFPDSIKLNATDL